MTKPYLYIDGDGGRTNNLYFPGDSNGAGNTITDDNTVHNLLNLNTAAVLDDDAFSVNGTDATIIPFQAPPLIASTGTDADDAINAGVVGIEWTGGGTSEQLNVSNNDFLYTYGENGQGWGAGAWVYLEAPSALNIAIELRFVNDASTVIHSDSDITLVQPEEWTYVSVASTINPPDESNSTKAYFTLEANGAQLIGDKLYVGAVGIGPSMELTWRFPTTPSTDVLDLRLNAKILGDGTLLSNRTGQAAAANGDCFHLEAINQGFLVQVGTRDASGVLTTTQYTTATDLYTYGKWNDFRVTYVPSTGVINFYILERGVWTVVDTTTISTTVRDFSTCYGLETLDAGLTPTQATHAIINSFGLFDDEDTGWRANGLDEESVTWTEPVTGSELVVYSDGTVQNYNESFYGSKSGWIINADSVDKGALQLPYRSELKYGTGDYTVVQSFAGVASHAGFTPTYDDHSGSTGLKFRQSSDTFAVLSGPVTVNLPANILDGQYRSLLVERESGVSVNAYVDDFDVITASGADGGADISNTEPLKFGTDDIATDSSMLPLLLGVTVTFNRLLEEYEKDDLFFWIESGFETESEPDWLRTEAVLYLNPNDPVQRAEYAARSRLINLGVSVPNEIYVRYDFTSDDGVSNPSLSHNDVRFANPRRYELQETEGYDVGPSVVTELGTEKSPMLVKHGGAGNFYTQVPVEELGTSWINDDWTINLWAKFEADGVANDVLTQGSTGNWSFRERSDNAVSFYMNSIAVLVATGTAFDKYTMITIRKTGSTVDMLMDGVVVDTGTAQTVAALTNDLIYYYSDQALLGPVSIWKKYLSTPEVTALYNGSPEARPLLLQESFTITDSFSTQSLNWQMV